MLTRLRKSFTSSVDGHISVASLILSFDAWCHSVLISVHVWAMQICFLPSITHYTLFLCLLAMCNYERVKNVVGGFLSSQDLHFGITNRQTGCYRGRIKQTSRGRFYIQIPTLPFLTWRSWSKLICYILNYKRREITTS